MPRYPHALMKCALAASLLVLAGEALASEPAVLMASFDSGQLSAELVDFIVESGRHESLVMPAGTDLLETVVRRCGKENATGHYLARFAQANAKLFEGSRSSAGLMLSAEQRIDFPACTYVATVPASVTVEARGPAWDTCRASGSDEMTTQCLPLDLYELQGPNLGQRYLQRVPTDSGAPAIHRLNVDRLRDDAVRRQFDQFLAGAVGSESPTAPDALIRAVSTQDVKLANPELARFDRLQSTVPILSPAVVSGRRTFALAVDADPQEVIQRLRMIDGDSAPETSSVKPVTTATDDSGCLEGKAPDWPVKTSQTLEILALTAAASREDGFGMDEPGRILIADSGLPDFADDRAPGINAALFPDRSGSTNAARRVWSTAVDAQGKHTRLSLAGAVPKVGHGLSVLGLAVGAFPADADATLPQRAGIQAPLALPVNLYSALGGQLASNELSLQGALDEDKWRALNIQIVNFSLVYRPDVTRAFDIAQHRPEVLFVIAAGNTQPLGIDVEHIYPANLGSLTNVITVAASQFGGTPAPFSNYGSELVDIAAPGCKLPVFDWDAVTGQVSITKSSGTSLAAPLVSLTASLLRRHRVLTVTALNRRILGFGDESEALQELVKSSSVLNIAKSLANRFDFIEDSQGQLYFGRIIRKADATKMICDDNRELATILSLTFWPNDGVSGNVLREEAGENGISRLKRCTLKTGQLGSLNFRRAHLSVAGQLEFSSPQIFRRDQLHHIGLCNPYECVSLPVAVNEPK